MSEVKEVKEIKLKPETRELADKLHKVMKIDAKTGAGTVPETWYVETLDKALPEKIVEKFPGIVAALPRIMEHLQDHNALVTAGASLAFGEASEKVLKKHSELTKTEIEIPTIRKDGFELQYERTRQVPTRNADGTTGTRAAYGLLRAGYHTYSADSVGELKKVKRYLSESAARVLGE
jgi:hypothetical protein